MAGNIVWLASYPKSGNTWMRAFIYNLVEQPARPGRIAELPTWFESEAKPRWYEPYLGGRPLDEVPFEEMVALRMAVHRDIAASRERGSVFVKTHNQLAYYEGHALHNTAVMAGAVVVVRNPLDVTLSMADHFGLSIDEAIEFMGNPQTAAPSTVENVASFLGSWAEHVESWTATPHPQIVVVRYEDLLDKPLKAFMKVARLLGRDKPRKPVQRAIEFSSFRVLKQQEAKEGFVERSPASKAFFRKGRKNQWMEALSDAQVARVVELQRAQMERFGYVPPRFR